jgi:hypothetical protein
VGENLSILVAGIDNIGSNSLGLFGFSYPLLVTP